MLLVQTKFTFVQKRPINIMYNILSLLFAVILLVMLVFLQCTTVGLEVYGDI